MELEPRLTTMESYKALEAFLINNPDLEELEALLDQFNIFEAIGAVRQELRHSGFLAFLLNPKQPHGLGDALLKRLLQRAVAMFDSDLTETVTAIDLALWDLTDMIVLREWQNIDILLLDEAHEFAVIIENKIGSSEHTNQLRRYRQVVEYNYPNCRILAIYLTPDGSNASDESYIPFNYELISELIENLVETRRSILGPEVLITMNHYTQMLRRRIVGESEIVKLCRRIYQNHQRALDLIYEYRPDRQLELKEKLENMLKENALINLDYSSKTYVRFAMREWDDVPELLQGQGWTPSNRILLFEFVNGVDSLRLKLTVGPGNDYVRERIVKLAKSMQPPFKLSNKPFGRLYATVWAETYLTKGHYEEGKEDELITTLERRWERFLRDPQNDYSLGALTAAIREEFNIGYTPIATR
jgi:hypothetical protein